MAALTDGTAEGTIQAAPVTPANFNPAGANPKTAQIPAAPVAKTAAAVVTPTSTKTQVTLGNGQTAFVDSTGAYTDSSGNPMSYAAVAASKAPVSSSVKSATDIEDANAKSASTLGSGNTPSANPFISTSDSVEQSENNTSSTVNNLTANNQATTDAHNTYLMQLQQEEAALEARRTAEVANIGADFDSQKAALDQTQKSETGQEQVITQRSGGYLGAGASQTGALISLNQTHQTEQAQLESKRQSALQAAQTAIDDKEFTVANAQAQEAKDYAAAIKQNQQDYLDNQIKIQKASEDAVASAQSQADASLKALSTLTPDEVSKLDPAQLTKIDQAYGVSGFAKNYIAATSAANAAKSQSDLVDAQQKLLTLLQDIPQGQKVSFPDPSDPNGPGITYTGMGKIGDISTFNETDNNGNVTIVAYNKATNTVTRTSAGQIGKQDATVASGTRLGYMDEFISDPKNKILVPSDPTNPNSPSYMTADNYVAMYQKYVKQYPGQADEFLKQYPVQETVLPSQRKSTELNAFSQTDPNTNPSPTATALDDGGSGAAGQ